MNSLDDDILNALFRVDKTSNCLLQQEDAKFEYKKIFHSSIEEKYLKAAAALYNYEGGYIVFGIDDTNGEVVGLTGFSEPDISYLSQKFNHHFQPNIKFNQRRFSINGKVVFIVYIQKREGIPTVCQHSFGKVKESAIIYRYAGQSMEIKAGDLIDLLHRLKGETVDKQIAVAEKHKKDEIRPYIKIISGGTGTAFQWSVIIQNKGKRVKISEIKVIEGAVRIFAPVKEFNLEENETKPLIFSKDDSHLPHYTEYKIEILYSDSLGTKYKAIGKLKGLNGEIDDGVEI